MNKRHYYQGKTSITFYEIPDLTQNLKPHSFSVDYDSVHCPVTGRWNELYARVGLFLAGVRGPSSVMKKEGYEPVIIHDRR